jgi:DnaD/phage-associated family protein
MVAIPEPFFLELLPTLQNADEIRVILYTFWFLSKQEKRTWFVRYEDYLNDEALMQGFQPGGEEMLNQALKAAVGHRVLLNGLYQGSDYYFVNSPRGRAAVKALEMGNWNPDAQPRPPVELGNERPTIFYLYEENIGPLTPLMSEILQDAEETYAYDWISDAIRIAVEKNVRNWRYVEAILKSWQKEGRHEKDRRNDQEDRRKYIEGEYGDLIEY